MGKLYRIHCCQNKPTFHLHSHTRKQKRFISQVQLRSKQTSKTIILHKTECFSYNQKYHKIPLKTHHLLSSTLSSRRGGKTTTLLYVVVVKKIILKKLLWNQNRISCLILNLFKSFGNSKSQLKNEAILSFFRILPKNDQNLL